MADKHGISVEGQYGISIANEKRLFFFFPFN